MSVCQDPEIGIWLMYITWQLFPSSTELIISALENLFLSYRYQSFILMRVQGLFADQLNISKVIVRSLIRYMYVAKVSKEILNIS